MFRYLWRVVVVLAELLSIGSVLGSPPNMPLVMDVDFINRVEDVKWYDLEPINQSESSVFSVTHRRGGAWMPFDYPWRVTAGIEQCEDVKVHTGLWLRPGAKIRVFANERPVRWMFPRPTKEGALSAMFVEVLSIVHEEKEYPFEVRTRKIQRGNNSHSVEIFAPVRTAEEFEEVTGKKIQRIRKVSIRNERPLTVVDGRARLDILPSLPVYVVESLLARPFKPTSDTAWDIECFAPTAKHREGEPDFNIVPVGYRRGAVSVDKDSCKQCHAQAGASARGHAPEDRYWFGHVRGSDGILSWHPFEDSSISDSAFTKPVKFRDEEWIEVVDESN